MREEPFFGAVEVNAVVTQRDELVVFEVVEDVVHDFRVEACERADLFGGAGAEREHVEDAAIVLHGERIGRDFLVHELEAGEFVDADGYSSQIGLCVGSRCGLVDDGRDDEGGDGDG